MYISVKACVFKIQVGTQGRFPDFEVRPNSSDLQRWGYRQGYLHYRGHHRYHVRRVVPAKAEAKAKRKEKLNRAQRCDACGRHWDPVCTRGCRSTACAFRNVRSNILTDQLFLPRYELLYRVNGGRDWISLGTLNGNCDGTTEVTHRIFRGVRLTTS